MPRVSMTCAFVLIVCLSIWPARAADKPLDYRQRETLKEVTSLLEQAKVRVERMEKAASPEQAKEAMGGRDKVAENLKYAEARLEKLPAEHKDVKPQAELYEDLKARLPAAEKKLAGDAAAADSDAAARAEGFKTDFERLKEMNAMFANPRVAEMDPERAAEVFKQIGPMKQERQRIVQKYENVLEGKTPGSRQMQTMLKYSDDVFGRFEKSADDFMKSAPGQIDKHVAEALDLAGQGVEEKKPAFFGPEGGVRQRFRWADQRLAILEAAAPDSPEVKQAAGRIKDARAEAEEMAKSLRGAIIEANRVPQERYGGADAAALRELVNQKWAKDGNGAEVLKVGLNGQNWKRDTLWEWSRADSAFHKVDKSRLQGFVVVKQPGDVAAVYYVNLVKDHLAGDSVQGYFVDSVKGESPVENLVLMKNAK